MTEVVTSKRLRQLATSFERQHEGYDAVKRRHLWTLPSTARLFRCFADRLDDGVLTSDEVLDQLTRWSQYVNDHVQATCVNKIKERADIAMLRMRRIITRAGADPDWVFGKGADGRVP